MSWFIPDSKIRCENCHELFRDHIVITNIVDMDKDDTISKSVLTDLFNRVICPYCKTEFTYETPVLLFSFKMKVAILTMHSEITTNTGNFPLLVKFAKANEWKFRLCDFFCTASEKMRIFKDGLCDASIELIKNSHFKEYAHMKLDEEYIAYDYSDSEFLYFSKRNDFDNVLEKMKIPYEYYNKYLNKPKIPGGNWTKIDRDWAVNHKEELL